MRRKMMDILLDWKAEPKKNPLLIRGARQVGKTYVVNEFSKSYPNYIYINFEEEADLKRIFEGNLDINTLIMNISMQFIDKRLEPGKTLIFIDEIQACPNARTALKFFAIDGRFDIIASGSLLGMTLKEVSSYPVGYEDAVDMYSMDFEEFLWALGASPELIEHIASKIDGKQSLENAVLDSMDEYFRWYMIVGGMPAAVSDFAANRDFGRVRRIQRKIVDGYMSDISKHASGVARTRAKECLGSVP